MRYALSILVFLVVSVLALPSATGQSYEEYEENGHVYTYVSTSRTWADAKTSAEDTVYDGMKGYLATITTEGENDFIQDDVLYGSGSWWFGGSDAEVEGTWKWVTGETWSYTNWASGEPNNVSNEDAVEFIASSGQWNDNRDYRTRPYLVEFERVVFLEINSGATGTNSTSVTLGISWKTGLSVQSMRFRNVGDSWSDWETAGNTKSWTLPTGDGEKIVEVEVEDSDGDVFSNEAAIWIDQTPPTGSITIESGADWTAVLDVTLSLLWSDQQSGVSEMRLRNPGSAWGVWTAASATASWTMPAGDGLKTVDAEFRDGAGNVSDVVSDTILLDQTAPEVTLDVADGKSFTDSRTVSVHIQATDAGSGLMDMRFRRVTIGGPWEGWLAYQDHYTWSVTLGDGSKTIEAQVRDRAGNVSTVASDSVTLDSTAPECTSFRINVGQEYVLPQEPIEFEVYSSDKPGGSGVEGFKASFDGGKSWSDWYSLIGGYLTEVDHPDVAGLLTARIQLRDRIGNESDYYEAECYLVETDLMAAGGGAKLTGAISPAADVDTFAVDLVTGDVLTVKVGAKSDEKGKSFVVGLDLVSPGGNRLHVGRYPADSKKVMISGFVAPGSGRYLVVARRESESESKGGSLKLSVKVKQSKINKKGKGASKDEDIVFQASVGSLLKASLKGEGLQAAHVTLTGPDGPVSFEAKEKKGKVTILPTVLTAGTGTYVLSVSESIEVSWKWGLKLPKKVKGEIRR
jgi:hypothetical protein